VENRKADRRYAACVVEFEERQAVVRTGVQAVPLSSGEKGDACTEENKGENEDRTGDVGAHTTVRSNEFGRRK
jgi:hypothetical protein